MFLERDMSRKNQGELKKVLEEKSSIRVVGNIVFSTLNPFFLLRFFNNQGKEGSIICCKVREMSVMRVK